MGPSRRGENLEIELNDQLRDLEIRGYERFDQKNTLLFNATCRFADVEEGDVSGNGKVWKKHVNRSLKSDREESSGGAGGR